MNVPQFWDFCQRPENRARILELLYGEVIELPIPYLKHGVVCARMGFLLDEYARRLGRGYVLLGCVGTILQHDPPSVLGPDVAYHAHWDSDADPLTGWANTMPELVVEAVSPNDNPTITAAKIREYLRNGVKIVWLVNCEERNVIALRPNQQVEVVGEEGELTGGEELAGLSIQVADIFKLPSERAKAVSPSRPERPAAQ